LIIDEEMTWQFTLVASPSSHARLTIALSCEFVTLIRHDSFDVAITTFTEAVGVLWIAEISLVAAITKLTSVAFFAVTSNTWLWHVTTASELFVGFRTRTGIATLVRVAVVAFSTSVTIFSTGVSDAILKTI
jgi:hypothetical protein